MGFRRVPCRLKLNHPDNGKDEIQAAASQKSRKGKLIAVYHSPSPWTIIASYPEAFSSSQEGNVLPMDCKLLRVPGVKFYLQSCESFTIDRTTYTESRRALLLVEHLLVKLKVGASKVTIQVSSGC